MGPAQPGNKKPREITVAELLAAAEKNGMKVTDAPEAQELSIEQKLAALGDHMTGALGNQEGLTDEQKAAQLQQMRQAMQMEILMKEKEVLRKYPDATPDQQWQIANAMITGNVFDVLEHSNKMFSAAAEKEKEASARDMDLNIEGDSGGDGDGKDATVGLDQLFAPGGTLDASLNSRASA